MDGPAAFDTGVTIIANINTLRKSTIIVALLNFFSMSIKHFCNDTISLPS